MSSILDALKKLEDEKEEQDPSRELNFPQPVNTKGAFYRRLNEKPSLKPFMAGGVMLLVVAIGCWLVLFRGHQPEPLKKVVEKTESKPFKPPAEQRHADLDPPKTTEAKPVKKFQGLRSRHSKHPKRSLNEIPSQLANQESKPEPQVPVKTFSEEEVAALSEILPQNTPRGQVDLKAMWDKRIKEHEEANQTLADAKPEPEQPEAVQLDEEMTELLEHIPKEMLPPEKVVESGWLKLQAISWSDDPARRIAVINSILVKEGRKIDGALVRRIERDYVVIEKNGEELMLPFGN